MSSGVIFQHFWLDQNHDLELRTHENIKNLVGLLPNNVPVLAYDIRIKEIGEAIRNKFTNLTEFWEISIANDAELKQILKNWIQKQNIKNIYIAGLHFNCCVMQLTTKLKEIAPQLGLHWNWDFVVKIIEECTISLHEDKIHPCELTDTKLHMDYSLVPQWLIKKQQVLNLINTEYFYK